MNKNFLGVLGAFICTAGGASQAAAQTTNVQVYGVIDNYIGAIHSSGKTGYADESGGLQVSRIGFRGTEELGGGLLAKFTLENGFNGDNGSLSVAGSLFNRQAWVGLANPTNWGEVRFGQQNSVMFTMLGNIAAFYGGTFGAGLGTQSGYNFRNSNDTAYLSPTISGWRAELHYALGEQVDDKANGSVMQAALEYKQGPWYFLAAHLQNRPLVAAPAVYSGVVDRQTAIGGSVEVGQFTYYLGYFKNKQTDNTIDKNLYSASIAWKPTGVDQISFGYTYIDVKRDNANVDLATFKGNGHANHLGLMVLHNLSKRTTIYSSLAHIINSQGTRYAMNAAQAPTGAFLNRPLQGDATTGFQVGIRHVF